jgi:hypothetical protein
MSIAYLFLVLVFLILHPPSWSYSMQVGSIRILRKATYKKLGTHKKLDFLHCILNNRASSSEVGGSWNKEKAGTRNTPENSACMENEKEICPSLILLSNYYFKNIFIASMI